VAAVIGPLVGAVVGAAVGRRVGRAYGKRRADELAWQIADTLAAPQQPQWVPWAGFVVHPDGTVDPPPAGP
jgi:hypothetical protein